MGRGFITVLTRKATWELYRFNWSPVLFGQIFRSGNYIGLPQPAIISVCNHIGMPQTATMTEGSLVHCGKVILQLAGLTGAIDIYFGEYWKRQTCWLRRSFGTRVNIYFGEYWKKRQTCRLRRSFGTCLHSASWSSVCGNKLELFPATISHFG